MSFHSLEWLRKEPLIGRPEFLVDIDCWVNGGLVGSYKLMI